MKLFIVSLFTSFVTLTFYIAESNALDEGCVTQEAHESLSYLLIDRSDKIEDIAGFKESLGTVKQMIKPGERLVVGVSTGKGNDTHILLDLVKPVESVWVSTLKIRAGQKHFNDCFTKVMESLATNEEKYDHSAILETLSFVSKIVAADTSAKKRLLLYSDMMQNSQALSFYTMKAFSPESALKITEKEGLLSKFPQVEVYAAGTGARQSDKQSKELEKYWSAYFEKSGAQLKFYGPVLIGVS